jgi:hypothetical protein
MVQILSAVALAAVLITFSVCAVKASGLKNWMIPAWLLLTALLVGAGYMEYYVQRHGREAAFAYSVMCCCLTGIVVIGLLFWFYSITKKQK